MPATKASKAPTTAHLLKLLFSCSPIEEETYRIASKFVTGSACSIAFSPRIPDGIGSQSYKRISWLFDAAFVDCRFVHAKFTGREKKGTLKTLPMHHGTPPDAAESFFNMGGPCDGFPCAHGGRSLVPAQGGSGCDLKRFFQPFKTKLTEPDGEEWFIRECRGRYMSGTHCAGELPPLRHTTSLFDYPKSVCVLELPILLEMTIVEQVPRSTFRATHPLQPRSKVAPLVRKGAYRPA
jgi:hypothetical protein